MTKRAGRNTKVYIGGYDLSTDLMNSDMSTEKGDLDITGFGPGAHARMYGLNDSQATMRGFFETEAIYGLNAALFDLEADSFNHIDTLYSQIFGEQGGVIAGDPAVSIGATVVNGRAIPSAVDGRVDLNFTILGQGQTVDHHMRVIAPQVTQVAAGSTPGFVSAISSDGGVGTIHALKTWGATNEVQTLTVTPTPTSGAFVLTFNGFETSPIAYNASAATIQAALAALPSIGSGNVLCAGGPINTTPVTVTFQGELKKRSVDQMTVTHTFNSGSIAVATTTPGVCAITAKIQHSSDTTNGLDGTWVDLITFAVIDGPDAERKTVTGTVNKGLRVITSGTLEAFEFIALFKRF